MAKKLERTYLEAPTRDLVVSSLRQSYSYVSNEEGCMKNKLHMDY